MLKGPRKSCRKVARWWEMYAGSLDKLYELYEVNEGRRVRVEVEGGGMKVGRREMLRNGFIYLGTVVPDWEGRKAWRGRACAGGGRWGGQW